MHSSPNPIPIVSFRLDGPDRPEACGCEAAAVADAMRALESGGFGQWRMDVGSGRIEASALAMELHGLSDCVTLVAETVLETIHPADAMRVRARLRKIAKDGGTVECSYRPRGGHRWIGLEAWCDGSPLRIAGVVWDDGAPQRRDAALRLAVRRLERLVRRRNAALVAARSGLERHASTLRMALESSGAVVRRLDLRSGKMDWDAAGLRLIGFGEGEEVTMERILVERIHPEHRGSLAEALARTAAGADSDDWDHEFLIMHPERGERWINSLGKVVRDADGDPVAIEGLVLDVTERKEREEMAIEGHQKLEQRVSERTRELRESEARFRMLSEASAEGVVISRDGIVMDVSARAAEMLGYECAEMIGRSVGEFVPPGERERVIGKMRSRDEEAYSSTLLHKSGRVFPITCRGRTIPHGEGFARVSVLRDQTDAESMAHELQARRTELERTLGLALVSEVSAAIIQRLGDPLDDLKAVMERVNVWIRSCGTCGPKWREALDDIGSDLRRMREIVVHLRSLEIPAEMVRVPVRVDELVDEMLPLLAREAEDRLVVLRAGPASGVFEVKADPVQIKQVVINLVRNSIEACEAQPIGRRMVAVETRGIPGQGVEIVVRDTGCGLASEVAERLFTPFQSTKAQGIGIGLRLCQTIVMAHGGSISGANAPDGGGAWFTVFLPQEMEVAV